MEVLHTGGMQFVERNNPRGGVFQTKPLFEGAPGTPGNFFLSISRTFEDFFSPRHRHNFDQIRVQLTGESSFARDGMMRPGTIGYFPEGTYYGPQTATGEAIVMVLQFGRASGNGYMSEAELQQSVAALKQVGEFKEGVFNRTVGDGRKRQDAYEAAWENWSGRRMVYPPQRYGAPVMMYPEAFSWRPVPDEPGTHAKRLGAFGEAGTELSLLRLDPGARTRLGADSLVYLFSGTGEADAVAVEPETALRIRRGETVRLSAGTSIEALVIGLPRFEADEAASF